MHIGEDWLVMDIRGLLRNARWRGLLLEGATPKDLLGLFTGCPIIDPNRGVVTFLYREGVVPVQKKRVVTTKKSVDTLLNLTTEGPLALVSIDLGQTNPVSTRVSIISQVDESLHSEYSTKFFLPSDLLTEIQKYRERTNLFEANLDSQAVAGLTEEQQSEVDHVYTFSSAEAKKNVCHQFGVPEDAVLWDNMDSWSSHIAKWVDKYGDRNLVWVPVFGKGNKIQLKKDGSPRMQMLTDSRIANLQDIRPRLPKPTRDQLNQSKFRLRFNHPEYHRLALSKKELSRRVVNYLVDQAKVATSLSRVVFSIENLQVTKFHGSGKREIGWGNYFTRKQENRWFIPALHKAISELATHRGIQVIEVIASWTSCTCPKCGYCDKGNRNGETFVCLGCSHHCNADLDTATFNIERITITGKGMSGPARERLSDVKSAKTPRNGKPKQVQQSKNTVLKV
jgi:hypothetical protein